MNCTQAKEILWQYHMGEIEESLSRQVEGHLRHCPGCSRELETLKSVTANLPAAPERPEAYWESYARSVLGSLEKERDRRPRLFLRRLVPATALLLVMAGAAIGLYRIKERNKVNEIVANLELLQDLEILTRNDFDALIQNSKESI